LKVFLWYNGKKESRIYWNGKDFLMSVWKVSNFQKVIFQNPYNEINLARKEKFKGNFSVKSLV
jgi:hypothetical protein